MYIKLASLLGNVKIKELVLKWAVEPNNLGTNWVVTRLRLASEQRFRKF